MTASCPNCGAPIEFRYDDSFVRVCDHCKSAVLRTDRGLDTLGRVADLAPIDSPLALFAEGHYGKGTFLLVGMAQIRHPAGGIWQEWYAKLDGGAWGWLAEAQGRYYLTFEQPGATAHLPRFGTLAPGASVELPVVGRPQPVAFTVGEITSGTYLAARGELPFKLVPEGNFRSVDLASADGLFATIDYGEDDGDDAPALYVGQELTLAELRITGGEVAPARDTIATKRLACPKCNAPVELHLPGESLRVVCGHCNTILGVDTDAVQVIATQKLHERPPIPLGSKCDFGEGELVVIGAVKRSANVSSEWWPFHEYLLHAPAIGFRWLVDSDGHWSYVQPVAVGAVTHDIGAATTTYDHVKFASFQVAELRVDEVLGEVYWRVAIGEKVQGEDSIAPPAMLSRETTSSEENWSLSSYRTVREVQRAFGDQDLPLAHPTGVAPNQIDASARATWVLTISVAVLLVTGMAFKVLAPNTAVYAHSFAVSTAAPAPAPPPASRVDSVARDISNGVATDEELAQLQRELDAPITIPSVAPETPPSDAAGTPSVVFSEPFTLVAGRNVELKFDALLTNNWAYIAADLVNQETGDVVDVDADLESYSGYDDGEYWSEGSSTATVTIGPVAAGSYLLRLESQHGGNGDITGHVSVRQGVFRGAYFALALGVLGIPWLLFAIHAFGFERKRWDQSTYGTAAMPKHGLAIAAIGGLFVVALIVVLS